MDAEDLKSRKNVTRDSFPKQVVPKVFLARVFIVDVLLLAIEVTL